VLEVKFYIVQDRVIWCWKLNFISKRQIGLINLQNKRKNLIDVTNSQATIFFTSIIAMKLPLQARR